MRKLAVAAVSIALIQTPSAAQIAIQSTPEASPKCEAGPDAQFRARRVSDVGNVSNQPFFLAAASRVVTVARDRRTSLLDVVTGTRIAELYPPGGGDPSLLDVSPDGEVALWSDGKGAVEMRRTGTGELISRPAALQRGAAFFSPDGSRLIVRDDETITILDGETGEAIGAPLASGRSAETKISSDGARLIVHDPSGSDAVISLRTGAPAYSVAVNDGEHVTFDDEGASALLTGGGDWRLVDPEKNVDLAKGVGEAARFSAGGSFVLAEGASGVRILDASTGRLAARPGRLAAGTTEAELRISPDGKSALTMSPDGVARLWDLVHGRGLAELGLFSTKDGPAGTSSRDFQYTPDGARLITRDLVGRLSIWDTLTGRRVATIGQFTRQDYLWIADDGAFAVAILADGSATLWNTRSGWRIASMGRLSPDPTETQFLLSPDRRILLVADSQKLELWDVERGVNLGGRSGSARLTDAVFSENGAWLVLRPSADKSSFEIWNARTGGRAGEATPADSAVFYTIAGEEVLLTRSTSGFALWHMKRGERATTCQFSDPELSMIDVFPTSDAIVLVLNVGGGQSELWRLERK